MPSSTDDERVERPPGVGPSTQLASKPAASQLSHYGADDGSSGSDHGSDSDDADPVATTLLARLKGARARALDAKQAEEEEDLVLDQILRLHGASEGLVVAAARYIDLLRQQQVRYTDALTQSLRHRVCARAARVSQSWAQRGGRQRAKAIEAWGIDNIKRLEQSTFRNGAIAASAWAALQKASLRWPFSAVESAITSAVAERRDTPFGASLRRGPAAGTRDIRIALERLDDAAKSAATDAAPRAQQPAPRGQATAPHAAPSAGPLEAGKQAGAPSGPHRNTDAPLDAQPPGGPRQKTPPPASSTLPPARAIASTPATLASYAPVSQADGAGDAAANTAATTLLDLSTAQPWRGTPSSQPNDEDAALVAAAVQAEWQRDATAAEAPSAAATTKRALGQDDPADDAHGEQSPRKRRRQVVPDSTQGDSSAPPTSASDQGPRARPPTAEGDASGHNTDAEEVGLEQKGDATAGDGSASPTGASWAGGGPGQRARRGVGVAGTSARSRRAARPQRRPLHHSCTERYSEKAHDVDILAAEAIEAIRRAHKELVLNPSAKRHFACDTGCRRASGVRDECIMLYRALVSFGCQCPELTMRLDDGERSLAKTRKAVTGTTDMIPSPRAGG